MSLPTPATAPRVNPLQRIWLREIGMERLWLRPAPVVTPPAVTAPVAAPSADMASAVTSQATVSKAVSPVPPAAPTIAANAVAPAAAVAQDAVAAVEQPAQAVVPTGRASGRPTIPASILNRSGPPPRPVPKTVEDEAVEAPRVPVAEAVKNATLDELREQVVACTACGLCQGRRHAVFGQGATPTRWLVVGEAPGEQEDRQGHPFVGRSGQLLDAMLAAVGMSRDTDVFITNVIKCRPPGNRNPKPEEIASCSPYLMRQIALLKPERILVLGRFAAQTLLGTDATIGSLRGRVHQLKTDDGAEIPLIVSYHPAYLLRSPSEKARAWQDLKLASRMV
ncbi:MULTISPECIES: uracil-DNA glycosylase [Achromobacter]|uniref:Type-4 uracil-DNA glycosylase n=1 Tax=Achromobacter spanius TaxID=217203 RepID=A0ABY8GSN2_9BURK|nr:MULTISPECIES: uracil-DNA glycosylase family protein [Achromobacter]WAI82958.1 uracil-DNA glycosylase [Achromobacter spanius]WEX93044.1 uracil-DNA glycosylase [Achromobacter sp. SS2-2022]WFP07802.1 uracil-DNA glycosylase family protein [Achromobacter spanius]